jgi:DNA ligase (NAD+)
LAKVVDIEWNVSKNGLVKPRIVLEPLQDATGVTITHCTGKNGRLIENMGVGKGAVIRLIRSGDVIPDLLSVEKHVTPDIPTTCPSCGTILQWTTDKDGSNVDLLCSNEECEGRAYKRVLAFFTGIEAEGFNKGTATKMVDAGYDIEAILRMPVSEIKALDGFAETSATKLYTNIKIACAKASLSTIMHAVGIFGRSLGSTKLGAIIDAYGDQLFLLTYSDIMKLPGFSDITAQAFMKGLTKFEIWWENNKQYFKLEKKEQPKVESSKLNGQTILFTGFRSSELEEQIIANGGMVASGMSTKVTILIAKDTSKGSSKLDKARKNGARIMSKDEFETFVRS